MDIEGAQNWVSTNCQLNPPLAILEPHRLGGRESEKMNIGCYTMLHFK